MSFREKYVFFNINMPVPCQEYMLFLCSFCMLRYVEWPEQPEPWLTTQWQTEKIAHTLGRGRAYIFDIFQKEYPKKILTWHGMEYL